MDRRPLIRYFGFVGLAYGVSTFGTGLADYLTQVDLGKTTNLLISGGIGLATALALGAIDLAKQGKEQRNPAAAVPGDYPGHPYASPGGGNAYATGRYREPRERAIGRGSILVGAVVLLALCAGGGYALTTGVQWAADKLSDLAAPPWVKKTQDPGTERLSHEVSETAEPLSVAVISVRVNDDVTMVRIHATNAGSDPLTLPMFGNAQLTVPGGTLQPDPAASDWPETVPAGGEATGTIVFDGVLPPGPVEIRLSFSAIYGSLDGPRTLAVAIPVT